LSVDSLTYFGCILPRRLTTTEDKEIVIPLHRTKFPGSKAELAQAMTESLRSYFGGKEPVVMISARVFPYLDEIAINLEGAQFDGQLPAMPRLVGETKSGCEAATVTLSGRNLAVQGAPVNLQLTARDVVFHEGHDEKGEALLLVHNVRTGHLVISAAQLDLENTIRQVAEREGRKHGILIEGTRVSLRARGSRSIAADVHLRARKFLLRANVDITAQIDVEKDFAVRLSNLKCRGDGMVGSLACDVLGSHLRQLDGKTFSIMPLLYGEIQLHDVRIAVADTVEITADFGAAAE
jgi:hypothetical protein